MQRLIPIILSALLVCSACENGTSDILRDAALIPGDSLVFNFSTDAATRSLYGVPNCNFGNGITMAIYYNGSRVAQGSCTGSSTRITISTWSGLAAGKSHNVYAVANAGTLTWPSAESGIEDMTTYTTWINQSYFPMSNQTTWNGTSSSMNITLKGYGCYVPIEVSVGKASGVTLKSIDEVTLMNEDQLYPFNKNPDQIASGVQDKASEDDLSRLENGYSITLYGLSSCGFPGGVYDPRYEGGASCIDVVATRDQGGYYWKERYTQYIVVPSDYYNFVIDGTGTLIEKKKKGDYIEKQWFDYLIYQYTDEIDQIYIEVSSHNLYIYPENEKDEYNHWKTDLNEITNTSRKDYEAYIYIYGTAADNCSLGAECFVGEGEFTIEYSDQYEICIRHYIEGGMSDTYNHFELDIVDD